MLADLDLEASQPHLAIVACYKILANKTAVILYVRLLSFTFWLC